MKKTFALPMLFLVSLVWLTACGAKTQLSKETALNLIVQANPKFAETKMEIFKIEECSLFSVAKDKDVEVAWFISYTVYDTCDPKGSYCSSDGTRPVGLRTAIFYAKDNYYLDGHGDYS